METPKALQAHHLSIHKFHAQLCHTPSFTHAHTFFTHNFVTHHLPHTTFTHSFVTRHLCHTPSFTHHLCHTPSFTHNFVTHHLSHTTLSHATSLHTHTQIFTCKCFSGRPPPPPLSILPSQSHLNFCFCLLEENDLWGDPLLHLLRNAKRFCVPVVPHKAVAEVSE